MTLSSAEIKRQVLMDGDTKTKRDEYRQKIQGIPEGEIIEMGNALEELTKTKGWIYAESYMIRRMNLVGLVFVDKDSAEAKGVARGFIEFMQWIQQTIQAKETILTKQKKPKEKKGAGQV